MNKKFKDRAQAERIASELAKKADQEVLSVRHSRTDYGNQNKAFESFKINQSLAKAISEFLEGKKDFLPNVDAFMELFKKANHQLVSMGYGVVVNTDLKVTYTTVLEDYVTKKETSSKEREDIFTPKGYRAIIVKGPNNYNNFVEIDVNKEPLFDKKRVDFLINYLRKCKEAIMSNEEENKVSLK